MLLAIECIKVRNLENGIVNGTKHEFIDQHYQSVRLNEKMTTYKTTDRNYVLGKKKARFLLFRTHGKRKSHLYIFKKKSFILE